MTQTPDKPSSTLTAAFRRAQDEARRHSTGIGIPAVAKRSLPRSGTMPDATGKVLCPACRKLFPFVPALLNRQIRCSGCKAVFRVAEDHRSFLVAAQPPPPAPETGTASAMTRQAIKSANDDLNAIARQALNAIASKEHPRTAPSDPALVSADEAVAEATRRFAKPAPAKVGPPSALRPPVPGEVRRRSRLTWIVLAASLALLAVAVLARSDERRASLAEFERMPGADRSYAAQLQRMSRLSLGPVEPVTRLDSAVFGDVVRIDAAVLEGVIGALRPVQKGLAWVEGSRIDEAMAFADNADLADGKVRAALLAHCRKLGIAAKDGATVVAEAEQALPPAAAGVFSSLLLHPAARQASFDPMAAFAAGRLPGSIRIAPFSGADGRLAQLRGVDIPVSYRGRLIRCSGQGWPEGWVVLELGVTGRQTTPE